VAFEKVAGGTTRLSPLDARAPPSTSAILQGERSRRRIGDERFVTDGRAGRGRATKRYAAGSSTGGTHNLAETIR